MPDRQNERPKRIREPAKRDPGCVDSGKAVRFDPSMLMYGDAAKLQAWYNRDPGPEDDKDDEHGTEAVVVDDDSPRNGAAAGGRAAVAVDDDEQMNGAAAGGCVAAPALAAVEVEVKLEVKVEDEEIEPRKVPDFLAPGSAVIWTDKDGEGWRATVNGTTTDAQGHMLVQLDFGNGQDFPVAEADWKTLRRDPLSNWISGHVGPNGRIRFFFESRDGLHDDRVLARDEIHAREDNIRVVWDKARRVLNTSDVFVDAAKWTDCAIVSQNKHVTDMRVERELEILRQNATYSDLRRHVITEARALAAGDSMFTLHSLVVAVAEATKKNDEEAEELLSDELLHKIIAMWLESYDGDDAMSDRRLLEIANEGIDLHGKDKWIEMVTAARAKSVKREVAERVVTRYARDTFLMSKAIRRTLVVSKEKREAKENAVGGGAAAGGAAAGGAAKKKRQRDSYGQSVNKYMPLNVVRKQTNRAQTDVVAGLVTVADWVRVRKAFTVAQVHDDPHAYLGLVSKFSPFQWAVGLANAERYCLKNRHDYGLQISDEDAKEILDRLNVAKARMRELWDDEVAMKNGKVSVAEAFTEKFWEKREHVWIKNGCKDDLTVANKARLFKNRPEKVKIKKEMMEAEQAKVKLEGGASDGAAAASATAAKVVPPPLPVIPKKSAKAVGKERK